MNSDDNISAEEAHATPVIGAGAQLRAAREASKLELTHIAAQTRIPLRHLESIEAGNFEALPSRAYAMGFSRSFARSVGLDEAIISAAVRSELADGTMRRPTIVSTMEPGDPAKLPSAGLAWAGAFAALVLAVGAIAFFNAYFGAGTEPDSLLADAQATAAGGPAAAKPTAAVPTGGEVVFTATEDGVWLRLYQEGGERLVERTLKQGEQVTVPAAASDPRINTGRPDALAITIGGTSVAPLSAKPQNMSGTPVSATALLARADPAASTAITAPGPSVRRAPRPAARRTGSADQASEQAPAANEAVEPAPSPAAEPAASTESSDSTPT